jgi:hypothetical protein
MALTDNRTIVTLRPDLANPKTNLDVAASAHIYKGAFVAVDGSGDAIAAPATGASIYYGIAANEVDNSSGALTTDRPLRIEPVTLLKHAVTGATAATIGAKVYYTADDTLSLTIVPGTGVLGSQVGRIHSIHFDGVPLVDVTQNEY